MIPIIYNFDKNMSIYRTFEFPHFAIHSAKRSCSLWQHRHLAQKVLEKLAFQSAFMCKVFSSLCDGNLLAL